MRYRKISIFLFIAVLIMCIRGPLQAEDKPSDAATPEEKVEIRRLENGDRVLMVVRHQSPHTIGGPFTPEAFPAMPVIRYEQLIVDRFELEVKVAEESGSRRLSLEAYNYTNAGKRLHVATITEREESQPLPGSSPGWLSREPAIVGRLSIVDMIPDRDAPILNVGDNFYCLPETFLICSAGSMPQLPYEEIHMIAGGRDGALGVRVQKELREGNDLVTLTSTRYAPFLPPYGGKIPASEVFYLDADGHRTTADAEGAVAVYPGNEEKQVWKPGAKWWSTMTRTTHNRIGEGPRTLATAQAAATVLPPGKELTEADWPKLPPASEAWPNLKELPKPASAIVQANAAKAAGAEEPKTSQQSSIAGQPTGAPTTAIPSPAENGPESKPSLGTIWLVAGVLCLAIAVGAVYLSRRRRRKAA